MTWKNGMLPMSGRLTVGIAKVRGDASQVRERNENQIQILHVP